MNSNATARKRIISKQSKCANPLFEQWLDDWSKEAADRNSDLQYCFGKALKSLRKCPIKFHSGKECLILKNFGAQLAAKLDRKLAEYRKAHPEEIITNDSSSNSVAGSSSAAMVEILKPKKRKRTAERSEACNPKSSSLKGSKPYVPELRSGAHAILCTMLKEEDNISYLGFMMKAEIMRKAQDLCDSSFTRSDSGNHYTAWNSMSTLIKKRLVIKYGNPAKYTLTEEGKALAQNLLVDSNSQKEAPVCTNLDTPFPPLFENNASPSFHTSPSTYYPRSPKNFMNIPSIDIEENLSSEDDDIRFINNIPNPAPGTTEQNLPLVERGDNRNHSDPKFYEQLIFLPGDFDIFLLVDTMETTGNRGKPGKLETTRELERLQTSFEVRHLKVGDFAWVARNKENKELLLPYIVERKRMDDLGKSIKDERFHEQKFRLRQCGLQNVIYLVEKFGNETRLGLPMNTLHQAIINSQVVDNFFVKTTNNHNQSMFYLSMLTKLLTKIFKDKTLISCARNDLTPFDINAELVSLPTFEEFSKFSMKNKNLKIRDMFMKQLIKLKGCSVEKASVIIHRYPTPLLLRQAFELSTEPETLLANITYGVMNRNIGPALSKSIYHLYTNRNLM